MESNVSPLSIATLDSIRKAGAFVPLTVARDELEATVEEGRRLAEAVKLFYAPVKTEKGYDLIASREDYPPSWQVEVIAR